MNSPKIGKFILLQVSFAKSKIINIFSIL